MRLARGRRRDTGMAAAGLLLIAGACLAVEQNGTPASIVSPLAERSLLLDADLAGGNVVAVGERGHVLLSEDGGASWRQVPAPTRAMLTSVEFYDGRLGFAVGHDATILRSVDGGVSWDRVYFEPREERPFLDVHFHDARHITAVGAYGYYLDSSDGGDSWTSRELAATDHGVGEQTLDAGEYYPEDFHLNHFTVSDTGIWYMAAEAGNIYRSDDRGANWQRMPSPYEGSYMGLLTLAQDRLLVYGLQGILFYSEDAGITWRGIDSGTKATLTDAVVLADGRVLLGGYSGSLVIADTDRGEARLIQLDNRMGISSLLQPGEGDLLLFGTGGSLRLSPGRLDKDAAAL